MRLYVDSAPLIYAVEMVEPFAAKVHRRFSELETVLVTSDLTRLECRVLPLRREDHYLLRKYDQFLAASITKWVAVSPDVLETATQLRAKYRFLKTPDAIHLASALQAECGVFYTNDHHLDKITELAVEILE